MFDSVVGGKVSQVYQRRTLRAREQKMQIFEGLTQKEKKKTKNSTFLKYAVQFTWTAGTQPFHKARTPPSLAMVKNASRVPWKCVVMKKKKKAKTKNKKQKTKINK